MPGLVWFIQPPGNAPNEAENSPALATGYLARAVVPLCWPLEQLLSGTAWASLQFCGDAQDRDALGWKSFSSQVTSLMGRGMASDCTHQWPGSLKERTQIFYWVAFTNHRVYCWPSCHLCQGCVWPMCYLGQDKIQRWGGPEQNWQLHLPDWNLKSLATFSWYFVFKYTWMAHL